MSDAPSSPPSTGRYTYPLSELDRRSVYRREVASRMEAGLQDFVRKTGDYAMWIVDRLSDRNVDPDISVDLIQMGPSNHGWRPIGRTALGPAWVLVETPKRWEPEHLTVNSDNVDYSENEHWDPAHPVPAQGWCLLKESAAVAYYAREQNVRKGDVFDKDWQPIVDFRALNPVLVSDRYDIGGNGEPTEEERLKLHELAGIKPLSDDDYVDLSGYNMVETLRIIKGWNQVFDGFVALKGLAK